MSFCGQKSIVQRKDGRVRAWRASCRSWLCPHCRPKRARQLRLLAAGGKPGTFITLTCNPAVGRDAVSRAKAMAAAWRVVVRMIKKRYKRKTLDYFVVVERTKRGEPHFHILLRKVWIDQAWLSAEWERLTGARIVDIRRVKGARQVINYVAKYVGKEPAHFGTTKRYWRSKGWDLRKRDGAERDFWKSAETEELDVQFHALIARWAVVGVKWDTCGTDYVSARWPPGAAALPFCLMSGKTAGV